MGRPICLCEVTAPGVHFQKQTQRSDQDFSAFQLQLQIQTQQLLTQNNEIL